MSPWEDVIPFYHVSAGVCTVSSGMGLWVCGFLQKCIMMVGNEQFLNASFLGQSEEHSRYPYRWQICCWYHKKTAGWQLSCS